MHCTPQAWELERFILSCKAWQGSGSDFDLGYIKLNGFLFTVTIATLTFVKNTDNDTYLTAFAATMQLNFRNDDKW